MKTYVLYHASCLDGSGAAFAAFEHFKNTGADVTYIPVQYSEPPPEMEPNSDVYILDFSYPLDVLQALKSTSNSLVVLDHHKTAKEALEGFPGATFDMSKSGAVLAWEYFHKGVEVPSLLRYVQDRDLWSWKLKETKAITTGLFLEKDFRQWDILSDSALALVGNVKIAFDEEVLKSSLKKATLTTYSGHRCALLNTTELTSEIGNHLCQELVIDFAIMYFVHASGDVVFSFRSLQQGGTDVSALAKALGGGGHKNAAGARVVKEAGFKLLSSLYSNAV